MKTVKTKKQAKKENKQTKAKVLKEPTKRVTAAHKTPATVKGTHRTKASTKEKPKRTVKAVTIYY